MAWTAGQPVIWCYRRTNPPQGTFYVAAEVVYAGPLRVRIRIPVAPDTSILRWTKAEKLRPRHAADRCDPYPMRA